MSGALLLFERYKQGGLPFIQALQGSEVETGIQDFKLFNSVNPNNWGRDDRKALSESLSGFANSDGGVIVWGVNCKKGVDANSADVVQGFQPVSNLTAVLAQMYTLSAQLVSPAVPGVEHIAFALAANDDSGHIVTYVPRGEDSPHMAVSGQRFMYRSGSSFMPMDYWMIADRFGRRPQPRLVMKMALVGAVTPEWAIVRFFLHNEGLGTAKFPSYVLHGKKSMLGQPGFVFDPSNQKQYYQPNEWFSGRFNHEVVIHAKQFTQVCQYQIPVPPGDFDLRYETFCEGQYHEGVLPIRFADMRERKDLYTFIPL